jgi:hypothetical protein
MSGSSIIICDIDGTIAKMGYAEGRRGPYDWDRVDEDDPNQVIIDLVKLLYSSGRDIIFVSGRMEQARIPTMQWIRRHLNIPAIQLFMRPDGDFRPDSVVKREIYERNIVPFYDVEFVLDDRNKVVKMWREELGLTVLQVADGDF